MMPDGISSEIFSWVSHSTTSDGKLTVAGPDESISSWNQIEKQQLPIRDAESRG